MADWQIKGGGKQRAGSAYICQRRDVERFTLLSDEVLRPQLSGIVENLSSRIYAKPFMRTHAGFLI